MENQCDGDREAVGGNPRGKAVEAHKSLLTKLNAPSRPPVSSWWATTPRDQWGATVQREYDERIKGSAECLDALRRPENVT